MNTDTKPLAALLLAIFPLAARAVEFAAPDSGSILQQMQPATPPAPASSGTGLDIQQKEAGKLPPSAPFPVNTIRITGNSLFDTQALHALVADAEGQSLTLQQLDKVAARLTEYYRSQGHPLARAYIPAQSIQAGVVRIEVMEARYGKIKLFNSSGVDDGLLEDTLSPLQSGQPIGQAGMERAMLLLSDIPGVDSHATLKPGEATGTSDLQVNAVATPQVAGRLSVDGYGNPHTGRERGGGTVDIFNPLNHGDVLSLSGLSSGQGMNFGRVGYESLLNGQGTRVGASYTGLRYELGAPLTALKAHGTAQIESLWARHPLLRSRDLNVFAQVQYEHAELRDSVDVSQIRTYRHVDNGTLILSGDARDGFLRGAVNTWSVSWNGGYVGFDNSAAKAADAATARSGGGFSKWNASFSRQQGLDEKNALYFAFLGQWANNNLDSWKKMVVGGAYSVRAYDMGAAFGDTGYLGTLELRHDLGQWQGQWQAVAFVDAAHVIVNETTWGRGPNHATLSGGGAGVNWLGPQIDWLGNSRLNVKAYIAAPFRPVSTLVASGHAPRAWLETGVNF